MITLWDLHSNCPNLNEEERQEYMKTFNEFKQFSRFESIRFRYNSIVSAILEFLETAVDPLAKRIQLEVFFKLLDFKTNNPALDLRVTTKCKQLFQNIQVQRQTKKRTSKGSLNSIIDSHTNKTSGKSMIGPKTKVIAPFLNGQTKKIIPNSGIPPNTKVTTWYDQINAIPNVTPDDKTNISEFLKFFEDNKIDIKASYSESIQQVIRYFDHWYKTIGISCAVLKRKAASLNLMYRLLISKHLCSGNPLLHSEVSRYISKLEKAEKSAESLRQSVLPEPQLNLDLSSSDTSVDINGEQSKQEYAILEAQYKADELELLELELRLETTELENAKWSTIECLMDNRRYKEFVLLVERKNLW